MLYYKITHVKYCKKYLIIKSQYENQIKVEL